MLIRLLSTLADKMTVEGDYGGWAEHGGGKDSLITNGENQWQGNGPPGRAMLNEGWNGTPTRIHVSENSMQSRRGIQKAEYEEDLAKA